MPAARLVNAIMPRMKNRTAHAVIFLALLTLAAVVRIPLVFTAHPFYSSDTAIIDLMARHFLQGEWAFYYWGEHYYGVLDPVLLMPLFKLFGQSIAVSGVVPFSFAMLFIVFFHRYVRNACGDWIAHGATLLVAMPSTIFLRYTFGTYNYSYGACMGIALLLLGQGLRSDNPKRWLVFGLCAGFSYYYFRFAMLFYLGLLIAGWGLDVAAGFMDQFRAEWAAGGRRAMWDRYLLLRGLPIHPVLRGLAVLFHLGTLLLLAVCLPLWLHGNVDRIVGGHRLHLSFWYTLRFTIYLGAMGLAFAYWREMVGWLKQAWARSTLRALGIGFLIGFAPGIAGAIMGQWPNSPGKVVSLPIWLANLDVIADFIVPSMIDAQPYREIQVFLYGFLTLGSGYMLLRTLLFIKNRLRGGRDSMPVLLLVGFISLFLGITAMQLGGVGTGRYLLPFMMALPLAQVLCLAWIGRHSRVLAITGVLFLAAANGLADRQLIRQTRGPEPMEAVSHHLISKGYRAGYADYWIAYRLTAVSHEQLVVAPTGDNDRYPPYLLAARKQETPFLLSYDSIATSGILGIKGFQYRVTGADFINGLHVYYLKRTL
jgi:hypothetical protein